MINSDAMKQFKLIIAMVVLVSSIVLFAVNLLNSQAIQIILETGQEVTTSADYFSLTKVLVLVTTAFLIGAAITYLFYNSDEESRIFKIDKKEKDAKYKEKKDSYDIIIPLLKNDEKKVVLALKEENGEILQNKLVLTLGFSKVRTTRLLASLERKNLIIKERFGLTNRIRFRK